MRYMFRNLGLFLVLACSALISKGQEINPTSDVKWPLITITGTDTPIQVCNASNYGQPFQRVDVTPNKTGSCGSDGWQYRGGSGSGTVNAGTTGQQGYYPGTGAAVSGRTATFVCDAFSDLAACVSAASAYAVSGKAALLSLGDHTYTVASPITLTSGLMFKGIAPPRLADCNANLNTCESPNGGTWITCTTGCFVAPGGASSGTNNVSFADMGFANWTGTAIQFGSATTVGLNSGYFQNVYFYGTNGTSGNPPASNVSDIGIALYNSQLVKMDNITGINVNTLTTDIQAGSTGSIGGNATRTGLTVQTYCKSVANGNSTKPGIFIGANLITLVRPQVNTYCGTAGVADGIQIATAHTTVLGADVEGAFLNAINLVGATNNYIDLATTAGSPTNGVTVDATSFWNVLHSETQFASVNIDTAAVSRNYFFGTWTFNNAVFGLYSNASNVGTMFLSPVTSYTATTFKPTANALFTNNGAFTLTAVTSYTNPTFVVNASSASTGIGINFNVTNSDGNGNFTQDAHVASNARSAAYRYFIGATEKWQHGIGGQSNDNWALYDAPNAHYVINLPLGMPANSITGNASGPILLTVQTPAARKGTFVCTGGGTITITNALAVATSDIIITMNTAGGTITTPPAFKTPGNGTNFSVLCGATDTSTYNYNILN